MPKKNSREIMAKAKRRINAKDNFRRGLINREGYLRASSGLPPGEATSDDSSSTKPNDNAVLILIEEDCAK